MNLRDRIAGGLVGLLVGDAVGVPYEGHGLDTLPPEGHLDFSPPSGFRRAHPGPPPGTWSDDGAQALCLLESLLERDRLDPADLGYRLTRWHEAGHMAIDRRVFAVAPGMHRAVLQLLAGKPALETGSTEERQATAGSLARALPLVLWHRGTDSELVADAHVQSQVTHAQPRVQVCCALLCLWGRRLLQEKPHPWARAAEALGDIYRVQPVFLQELRENVLPDPKEPGVVEVLHSARRALEATDFESVVRRAVALGQVRDTTACVAGGLAGLRGGLEGISKRWRDGLRGREIYLPLLERVLERHPLV